MDQHRELNEQCVTASEPRHVCLACGKRYKWPDSLRRHQRVYCNKLNEQCVTASRPRHVCLACGKRYKWSDSLRRHQRVYCSNKEK
ncbi:unnamed protein product [Heterotrigona itama]|uniref:C2H2-type domain-containing protein n=1 Tax=Heterotrigona itama TaxID=395501 RepID=A0A6V7HDQ2_9HYME|nr:unnamed protein product [Heterotrigona itama]